MKKPLTLKLIGGGLLLCIVNLLSLTSCENFLNGESVKEEIIDTIAYNNAKDISISLSCKEEMGIILPENTVSGKLGYNIDIQFIPNTSNYAVKNPDSLFEAVSRKDNSVSRSDCVEFISIEQSAADKKDGIYRAKVKVKNDTGDILIRPSSAACVLLPKITAITPENDSKGVDQDTKIKITFNKALNPESFGDFSRLEIYSAETSNLKEFFDTPYFSEDKKSMYITPKSSRLLLAPDGGKQFMDITVALELSDVTDCDGLRVSGKINHTYRINQSYGNQKKVKVLVRTVEGTGSFLSDGEKECTVGYSLGELQFTLNKSDYYFNGLEAVSKNDAKVSRAEKVSFTKTDFDEERGIYKYKVTVTEEADDILIQPKCILLPKARASYPVSDNTTYQQDTSIKVYFNKKIKLSDFTDENGFLKNIEIKSGDINLLDTADGKLPYYKAPYLEEEDKTLVIPIVKGNYIIKDNSTKEISVSVKLAGLKDAVEGENADFAQASYDFSFKINSTKDSVPPQFKVLRLARTEDDARNGTNLITMDEFTHYAAKANFGGDSTKVAENIQNHHVNKVWIYFEGEDADSGVAGLEIREQLIRKTTGDVTEGFVYGKDTNPSTNFIANPDDKNTYSDCVEYNFKSAEDGVVKLDFVLKDRAEKTTTKTVDLVKDTVCNISVELYNYKGNSEYYSKRYISDFPKNDEYPFLIAISHNKVKTSFMKDLNGYEYYDTYFSDGEAIYSVLSDTISFEYGYDEKQMNYIDLKNAECTIEDNVKIKKVTFNADPYKTIYIQATICDAAGNLKTMATRIPALIEVVYTDISAGEIKFILNNVSNTPPVVDCYYSLNNNDERVSKAISSSGITNSIISVSDFIEGYNGGQPIIVSLENMPDGYYSFSFYSTGGGSQGISLFSYLGDSVVVRKQENNFSIITNNNGTILAPEDIPDFEVMAEPPEINAGNRIININYKNFSPKTNLKYMIYYEGTNSKGYSSSTKFTVPSEYSDYSFKSVVFNENNDCLESAPKTLNLQEDNIPPKLKFTKSTGGFYYPKKLEPSYNMCSITVDIDEKNYDAESIKCIISDNSKLENIDWQNENDSRICQLPITKAPGNNNYWTFDYYYYNENCSKYCYIFLVDTSENFSEAKVYIPITKNTAVPSVSYSSGTFTPKNLGNTLIKQYINDNVWTECSYTSNNLTFSDEEKESFILIQSATEKNGQFTVYKPLYFYAPYEIAKNTSSSIVCKLKDLYIGKAGINILADQPCFAHTMYCTRNLGDSPAAWLDGGFETGLVMEQKSFTYANSKAAGVPQGNYYTTVVHFADGTTLMTDVKQK